ncbi:hypothetical protein Bbelb_169560 [Branchiostoma belcheri]|nr:hypothetical protein Bbelb_169560 [Branchiostoma belcheri]
MSSVNRVAVLLSRRAAGETRRQMIHGRKANGQVAGSWSRGASLYTAPWQQPGTQASPGAKELACILPLATPTVSDAISREKTDDPREEGQGPSGWQRPSVQAGTAERLG